MYFSSIFPWVTPRPYGTDTLRSYVRKCVLPLMEPDEVAGPEFITLQHKSHQNHLSVRPELWRRLENIYPLDISAEATRWVENHVPEKPIQTLYELYGPRDECLCIPVPLPDPEEYPPLHFGRRPSGMTRLLLWVDNITLMTVQHVLHVAFPESRNMSFLHNDKQDVDAPIFRYITWTLTEQDDRQAVNQAKHKSVLVAIQPPWILSPMDMKEFSNCKSFPPFSTPGKIFPPDLVSKHRVWAKLWDACVKEDIHWFVLTSYNQWIFGAFSPGWTTGFISEIYEFQDSDPTVVACILFWIASAMQFPGSCALTKVPEPVHTLNPVTVPANIEAKLPTPAMSESAWDGQSEDPGSSAGVWTEIAPSVSEWCSASTQTTVQRTQGPGRKDPSKFVESWLNGYTEPDDLPKSTEATLLQVNLDIDRYATWQDALQGEWLI